MKIRHIYIYPIKSLGGIEVASSIIEKRGLQFDRRYMLVDTKGNFLTQRTFPRLAQLRCSIHESGFYIRPDHSDDQFDIPFDVRSGTGMRVKVWNDEVQGVLVSEEADSFFSKHLGMACHLVYMPDDTERAVDMHYAAPGDITSFSDGYPILLIGTASLEDLNARLEEKISWDRFRPNLVLETQIPFAEDTWKRLAVGDSQFKLVKPCARCVVTTIDQQTAIAGKEPLRTLATYRTVENKVMFGMNVIPVSSGFEIRKGDEIVVLD